MRELIARSLYSSNLKQKESHCAIDEIHTLGIASRDSQIGVDAIRFIDGMQPKAYDDIINNLSRKIRKTIKCDKKILYKVCQQVVNESIFTFCYTCYGRKELVAENKVFQCVQCNGTGLHRHTDNARAIAIGLSYEAYLKHWAQILKVTQSVYSSECKNALDIARRINRND